MPETTTSPTPTSTPFTTQRSSSTRLYTLAHNPEYRNSLTIKGYLQSHMLDYYLGDGMAPPPVPNVAYVGQSGGVAGRVFHDTDADDDADAPARWSCGTSHHERGLRSAAPASHRGRMSGKL